MPSCTVEDDSTRSVPSCTVEDDSHTFCAMLSSPQPNLVSLGLSYNAISSLEGMKVGTDVALCTMFELNRYTVLTG